MFATESAPGLAISGITGGYLLKLIVALICVLLIFVFLALLTKKFNRIGQSTQRNLSVVSSMAIGARERVMVVQVGNVQLVLGVTPSRIENLHVLESPLPGTSKSAMLSSGRSSSSTAPPPELTPNSGLSVDFRQKLNEFICKPGSSA